MASTKTNLKRLLVKDWLEVTLDTYLKIPEPPQPLQHEPEYIRASWLSDDVPNIYLRLLGMDPPGNPVGAQLRRRFHDGNDLQTRYIRYFREMGILDEPEDGWDEDIGIYVADDKYGIKGHIDARIKLPAVESQEVTFVEMKAVTSGRYRWTQKEPLASHYHQVQMYLHLDQREWAYLFQECKDDQQVAVTRVYRDEEAISTALDKAARVWTMVVDEVNPYEVLKDGSRYSTSG
jgi:hypothetical protein